MKWFKHDTNAHGDAKLKKVRQKYGMIGYGLYWYCIELIANSVDKSNITFELEEDAETIAIDWNLDQLKVEEIMLFFVQIGLFESNNNVISCLKLAKRLDDTQSKNPEIKNIINKLYDSDKLRITPNPSDKLRITPKKSDQTRLDKIRLDKNNETNILATLSEVMNLCAERNIPVIPETHCLFEQHKKMKVETLWVYAAWDQFVESHLNRPKLVKQKSWPQTFHKHLKRTDWHQIWYIGKEDQEPRLTSNGRSRIANMSVAA